MNMFEGARKKREQMAGLEPMEAPTAASAPATGGARFGKQFTAEDKARQAAKLAEVLRKRGE